MNPTESRVSSAFDAIPATPVRRPNVYELIVDSIVELIQTGRLRPGDAIVPERALMTRFGAGRSSVREALRVLESKGVIRSDRGGFCVADLHDSILNSLELIMRLTNANVRDLLALRSMIEVETAATAALRRTDADVRAIREADEAWEAALRSALDDHSRGEDAAAADLQLHMRIAEAAGNTVVLALMQAVRVVVGPSYEASALVKSDIPELVSSQHRAIVQAIADGDPDAAREAMRAHLVDAETHLSQRLDVPLYE